MSSSVHATEVHRCRECREVVVIVPDGFTLSDEELQQKAVAHAAVCDKTIERILTND